MWKLIIGLVIGGCLAYFGYEEYRVGGSSSAEPVDVELADLEEGKPLPDTHVRIGKNYRLYLFNVFEYVKEEGRRPGPDTEVTWVYYPIVSEKHPAIVKLRQLRAKYGSLGKAPKAERPKVEDFAVLIKTERYGTVKELPDGFDYIASATGLVINRIESLGDEERRLIRGTFPKIDFDKVYILEEHREPTSRAVSIGFIVAGALVVLLTLWLTFRPRRAPKLPDDPAPNPPAA